MAGRGDRHPLFSLRPSLQPGPEDGPAHRRAGRQPAPRLIETDQGLETFFRIHGRTHAPGPLALYRLRLQAEALRLSRGFDQLICLEDIAVDHYEHQLETALRALRDMRGRALLADEVGLGKTIEAGIIMKELIERGLVRTVLVLTPASLTEQWREELSAKFREEFTVVDTVEGWQEVQTAETGRWIVSLDRAKRDRHSEGALAREYDLLIVDEAHKLKNRSTLAWKFVNQIRKRYVLMLTATPVQNDLMELYSLITILSPGQLGTVRGFRRHFLESADKRQPKNTPALRRLLNDVMIRNRRSRVDVTFPRRQAAIYHLALSEAEWQLYADVTDYIRRRFQDQDSTKLMRLTLIILQRELSSSPQAVASTLAKMIEDRSHADKARAELQQLSGLGRIDSRGAQIGGGRGDSGTLPRPISHLHRIPPDPGHDCGPARAQGIEVIGFHGGLNIRQKEAAVAAFKGATGVRVMVTTESGAEGRNLQFCHQLINYDLPWNPMRVEQRIGRLHRLGQAHDVTIFNLSCNETIEAHIIDLLARKIRMFELVIGELDLILGNIDGAKSFEDLLRQAWESATSENDLRERMTQVGDVLINARREYERVRESNQLLDTVFEE